MVILGKITTFFCVTTNHCICCRKHETKSAPTNASQTTSNNIWTTECANYDATTTITAMEAMSPSRTGILNHNFQPPGTKPSANLSNVTAASSMFPPGAMKTFYPQGQLCADQQCYHNEKNTHDAWYFSGSFTQDPRKPKEVTEL